MPLRDDVINTLVVLGLMKLVLRNNKFRMAYGIEGIICVDG